MSVFDQNDLQEVGACNTKKLPEKIYDITHVQFSIRIYLDVYNYIYTYY